MHGDETVSIPENEPIPVLIVYGTAFVAMAAAFFNQLAAPERAVAISAGTEPAACVHPEVQAIMQEVGIDLTHARPQKLTEELAQDVQLLITMGCGDRCPYVPGLRREDWPLQDPKGLPLAAVRCQKMWASSSAGERSGFDHHARCGAGAAARDWARA